MRIGFCMIGGDFWTGGLNYLESLLSAIHEYLDRRVEPVLFAGSDVAPASISRLSPYLTDAPMFDRAWNRGSWSRPRKAVSTLLLGRDPSIDRQLRRARIDVLFQHSTWLGYRFRFPTIAWIPDFQHLHRPDLFTPLERLKRSAGYELVTRTADQILVSSMVARQDCERFYPRTAGRVAAVPFAPRMDAAPSASEMRAVRERHQLPGRFLFMPNQLWLHKNHLNVVRAMQLLATGNGAPTIIACGNPQDYRQPQHPARVIRAISESGLGASLRFLGLVSRTDLACLLRLSCGLVNPSFFEGWSTTVEEAKSLAIPLVLSDIAVHREQAAGCEAEFFSPHEPIHIATALRNAWTRFTDPPSEEAGREARQRYEASRRTFALNFLQVCERAIGSARAARIR